MDKSGVIWVKTEKKSLLSDKTKIVVVTYRFPDLSTLTFRKTQNTVY